MATPNHYPKAIPRQRGFGIVELSITIIILGMLLLFTLKGTAVIENMRALAVSYELGQFQRLTLTYQVDRRNLPGDDPVATRDWGRDIALSTVGEVLASLEGNGKLDGHLYHVANPANEAFTAWQDLRLGGYIDGDPALRGASSLPENPFGGFYGFDEGNLGQKGGSLCATKIPGRAAEAIDQRMDDGRINTGKLVATSKFSIEQNNHFDAPDTEPYHVEKEYIICVPMLP